MIPIDEAKATEIARREIAAALRNKGIDVVIEKLKREHDLTTGRHNIPVEAGGVVPFLHWIDAGDYGAIENRLADDTAAIQAAVAACLADPLRPIPLVIHGPCKLTASIIINRDWENYCLTKGAFRIIGQGQTAGFYVSTAIAMFSSSLEKGGGVPVSEAISFENIQFEASSAALAAYVLSGNKICRSQFLNCRFSYIKCLVSTSYTQSLYFTKCIMREWSGIFHHAVSSYDISFEGNLIEFGDSFWVGDVAAGCRFMNNLLENMTCFSGLPISFLYSYGLAVVGSYFEACGGVADAYIDFGVSRGVSLTGNHFILEQAQVDDPTYYAVKVGTGATGGLTSIGNSCSGKLHDPTAPLAFAAGNMKDSGVTVEPAVFRGCKVGIGTGLPGALLGMAGLEVDFLRFDYAALPTYFNLKLSQAHAESDVYWNFVQRNNNIDYNVLTFRKGNVSIGTPAPAVSALLDLTSITGALLLTRMTTTQRDALTAVNGMAIYNSTTSAFNFYENGAWVTK